MVNPEMEELTVLLEGSTLAETFMPATGVPKLKRTVKSGKKTADSATVTVTTLVTEWAEDPATKEHRLRPASSGIVERVAFQEPTAGKLEHDKILSVITMMTQMFMSPDCNEGINLEYPFEVTGMGLRGQHKKKPLVGCIDCVLVDKKTGRFVVIEVKTKNEEKHARVVWMEAVVQARLYAFALKKHLKLDYVPDAYILSTVLYGDTLTKGRVVPGGLTPKGKVVPGGLYPVGL